MCKLLAEMIFFCLSGDSGFRRNDEFRFTLVGVSRHKAG